MSGIFKFIKKRWYGIMPLFLTFFLALYAKNLQGWSGLGFVVMLPILYGAFTIIYTLIFSQNVHDALLTALFVFIGIFLGLLLLNLFDFEIDLLLDLFLWGIVYGALSAILGLIKVGLSTVLKRHFEKFNK